MGRSKSRKRSKSRRKSRRLNKKKIEGDNNSAEIETEVHKIDENQNSEQNVTNDVPDEKQENGGKVSRRKSRRIKTTNQQTKTAVAKPDESVSEPTDTSRSAKKSRRLKRQE